MSDDVSTQVGPPAVTLPHWDEPELPFPPLERTAPQRAKLDNPAELREGKRHRRPQVTEELAARAIMPRSGTGRGRVLGAIAAAVRSGYYGLTDEEVCTRLRMNPSTERPRRVELIEGGYVVQTPLMRATRSGSAAIVWAVTPAGAAWAAAEGS